MNRFIFVRDKKIVGYLISFAVIVVLSYALTTFSFSDLSELSYVLNEMPVGFIVIFIVFLAFFFSIAVFYYYLFIKDCVQFVTLKENGIRFGALNLGYANYSDIEKVEFDTDIYFYYKGKKRKIRVFQIEKNIEKYETMLGILTEKTQLGFDAHESATVIEKKQAQKYETGGPPLRLNSWLMIIFVNLIISCALLTIYVLLFGFTASITSLLAFNSYVNGGSFEFLIIFLIMTVIFAFFLLTVIFMGKRLKRAVIFLKILVAGYFSLTALAFLSGIFFYVAYDFMRLNMPGGVLSYILMFFMGLLIMLIIFRYLNISRRVQKTFIYKKSVSVTKADKTVDPPFKLFSREPASLYGVLNWIIMPALFIVFYISLIVWTITAAIFMM